MAKRTVACPNGCDGELLERNEWLGPDEFSDITVAQKRLLSGKGTRYTCEGCGWDAVLIVLPRKHWVAFEEGFADADSEE